MTVVSLNIRAKTGATVVSVIRGGITTRNIGADFEFAIGDTLAALGDHAHIAGLKDILGIR
jgi:K+/H+ antiporter YhaU regulatory subunit KhtT